MATICSIFRATAFMAVAKKRTTSRQDGSSNRTRKNVDRDCSVKWDGLDKCDSAKGDGREKKGLLAHDKGVEPDHDSDNNQTNW